MLEKWVIPTFIMTLVGGFYVTLIKVCENAYSSNTIIPFCFLINAIMSTVKNIYDKVDLQFEKFSVGAGVTFGLTMYYFSKAISLIQNPAAAVVVARAQVILTFFGGILLFKTKFSYKKLSAILTILLGSYFTARGQIKTIKGYDWLKFAIYACVWSSINDLFSKANISETINISKGKIKYLNPHGLKSFTPKTINCSTILRIKYNPKKENSLKKIKLKDLLPLIVNESFFPTNLKSVDGFMNWFINCKCYTLNYNNDESLINHAEIIREKGTDRSSFLRGEVDKYGWKKLGSSFSTSTSFLISTSSIGS